MIEEMMTPEQRKELDAELQEIYDGWQDSEDDMPALLRAIYDYGRGEERRLAASTASDKQEAVYVPLEPTEEMIRAACLNQSKARFSSYEEWLDSHSSGVSERIRDLVASDYRAMVAAAPLAQSAEQDALAKVLFALTERQKGNVIRSEDEYIDEARAVLKGDSK
jgi:hypothetical protein